MAGGTICGSIDDRAGQPTACAAAPSPSSRYIDQTGPFWCDTTARPTADTNQTSWVSTIIRRRSNRSARWPAGRISAISGMAWARPIQARASLEPVRS